MTETFDIGGSDTVHRLGFGAMRLTGERIVGPPADEAVAQAVARRAIDLEIDLIDTADSYGPGVSERLLSAAGVVDDALVATKAGLLRAAEGDWIPHGDPDYIRNQALVSRDRLGVETIDLYQFHRPDPDTPFEDSIGAFGELKDDGMVRHVGLSNVDVEQLDRAREHVEIVTVQNRYNVGNREHEPVLEACEAANIGFIPWFPLGAGDLGGATDVVDSVASTHGASRTQVALAWLLEHSPVMLPIPGTSSREHLEENVAASELQLSEEEYERLTAAQ